MDPRVERIMTAAEYVAGRLNGHKPMVGIVLGSGLGRLADEIENPIVIPYKDIPGFPVSTAVGHKGNFIAGYLGGKPVIAMQGRFHYYEGYTMELVTLPIRVMKVLGIQYLFVSNAAGGVNYDFKVGDLMVITDHISHLPNPLIGPNMAEFGPRFPDMTRPYDPNLRAKAFELAAELGIKLKKGVYFAGTGPSHINRSRYQCQHKHYGKRYLPRFDGNAFGCNCSKRCLCGCSTCGYLLFVFGGYLGLRRALCGRWRGRLGRQRRILLHRRALGLLVFHV